MLLVVAIVAAMALNASSAMAKHQWSNYHWEFPAGQNQLTINVNNCQVSPSHTRDYDYNVAVHFSGPNVDWNDVIFDWGDAIAIASGSCPGLVTDANDPLGAFNTRSALFAYDATLTGPADEGTVNAFNANYGNNGWVGLAIINIEQSSGDNHIVYGEVYLNDYYATVSNTYNNALVMRKVQCQEVGHIFGLDHVRRDVSCMYSSAAFVGGVYTPNDHDGKMVNAITDGHGGSEPPPPEEDGKGPCAKNPDHWKCQAGAGVFRGRATWVENYESLDEMFEAADVVVGARVLNGSMFDRMVGAPGRGLPVSQAVLQIRETFKGKAKGVIRVEHTRGLGLEIEDDPGYVNGDDYLLFLRKLGPRMFRVVNPKGRIQQ